MNCLIKQAHMAAKKGEKEKQRVKKHKVTFTPKDDSDTESEHGNVMEVEHSSNNNSSTTELSSYSECSFAMDIKQKCAKTNHSTAEVVGEIANRKGQKSQ